MTSDLDNEGVNYLHQPNDWNVSEIHEAIGSVAIRFPLLHCEECAVFIREWLQQRGISGKLWRLSTQYDDEDFIVSSRLEQEGNTRSITENGVHYGIEVFGKVFDNLSQEGLAMEEWVNDFTSISNEFELEVIEEF